MSARILSIFLAVVLLAACSSTSTPDLKVIAILNCGENQDDCRLHEDNECEGRGRFNDLSNHGDVVVSDNMGKRMKGEEMELGTYDEVNNVCTFSTTISIKSSSSYQINIGDLPGTRVMKSDLENQNWTVVLEFNQ